MYVPSIPTALLGPILYVLYISNSLLIMKLLSVVTSASFYLFQLMINNHPVDLISDAISGVNIESCEHPCVGKPCLNGGECIPKKDVYSCYCPLGFSGNSCQLSKTTICWGNIFYWWNFMVSCPYSSLSRVLKAKTSAFLSTGIDKLLPWIHVYGR